MNRLTLVLSPNPRWKARLAQQQRRRPAAVKLSLKPAWPALDRLTAPVYSSPMSYQGRRPDLPEDHWLNN